MFTADPLSDVCARVCACMYRPSSARVEARRRFPRTRGCGDGCALGGFEFDPANHLRARSRSLPADRNPGDPLTSYGLLGRVDGVMRRGGGRSEWTDRAPGAIARRRTLVAPAFQDRAQRVVHRSNIRPSKCRFVRALRAPGCRRADEMILLRCRVQQPRRFSISGACRH